MSEINTSENEHLLDTNAIDQVMARREVMLEAQARLLQVGEEFKGGFEVLNKYDKTVTVFGSARLAQDHPASVQASAISAALAKKGYAVVTGGGNGIMEAANHGAKEAGGNSVGINIELPMEQNLNSHTTDSFAFKHFFARKVVLTLGADGYVFCAGGFGTFDEFFEIITLIQTKKIPPAPIVLVGDHFWKPLDHYFRQMLRDGYKTINPEDLDLYTITEDIDEIIDLIEAG